MANPEHVEIVKAGKEAIDAWRIAHPEACLDLSEADLTSANLIEANLIEANLIEANLIRANLTRAELCGANLRGSNLIWALLLETDFYEARLVEANVARADAVHCNFSQANLFKTSLCETRLIKSDLIQTYLSRAELLQADLFGSNLSDANLSEADLRGANLSHAWFCGANLREADLDSARLNMTHLEGADLTQANLGRAILNRAYLEGADLSGARCSDTVFAGVDLSSPVGIETIKHDGPSLISVDTLYDLRGKIPDVFLRGSGVPENLITDQTIRATASEFYSCFISYSHEDKVFARRLHDALQGRGIRCWLDEHQLLPGDNIYEHVDRAIREWDKVLLCCSKTSLTSWWVEREIDRAFKKEMQLMEDRGVSVLAIIPLNLDDHFMKWDHPHAAALQKRLASDFTGWEQDTGKFEREFEKVVRALRADDGARETPPEPKL